ncbi:GntR family transcriptional regulator [Rhodococcus triatomae]|uniref:DNA-binding transcriptional regulator, GntR family n=1 Tax=Rhodococcus triatomae TaxID=300028 RepID=A0A1G8GFE0_9NOCA|nr:GntR family transcriptional regulator [Rhodococcus triatomae]QNG20395.1 GntR family transcriptional regulator [Rhodococcus triatomae]QNG23689.1 GntR family transcriptional regulator [Rhodococcus triatomae]SDH93109.1 DNA-binding transcriptional regulator, GntR family [Rhodococcus triatomae]
MNESEPAYRVLSGELRREIAAGRYRGGVRLPTEAQLSEEHGLSRQTVRRAFQDLVAEGIVYRVPGRGTFAIESDGRYLRQLGSIEDLMNLSADTTMRVIEPLTRRIDVDVASRLRLDTDVVYRLVFARLHDGVPFVVTTVFLPQRVARPVLDAPELQSGATSEHTIIGLLEPHLTHPIGEAAQSITVGAASPRVAAELGCAEGHPMLRVDRLYSDTEGLATELAVSYFLPEHYTYRVTLRRSGR